MEGNEEEDTIVFNIKKNINILWRERERTRVRECDRET